MIKYISRYNFWLFVAILIFIGLPTAKGTLVITFEDNLASGINVSWSGSGNTLGASGPSVITLELPAGVLQPAVNLTDQIPNPNTLQLAVGNPVIDFGFFGSSFNEIDVDINSAYSNNSAYNATGNGVVNVPFNNVFLSTGTFNVTSGDAADFGQVTVNVIPEPSTWFAGMVALGFVVLSNVKRQRHPTSEVSS